MFVERGSSIVFRQDSFQARVVALDGNHRVIDNLPDGRLFRVILEIVPSRSGRHPEDIFGAVLIGIFGICACLVGFASYELRAMLFEAVGNIFEEDQAKNNVLVFRRIHVAAELISSEPKLSFEANVGRIIGRVLGFPTRH